MEGLGYELPAVNTPRSWRRSVSVLSRARDLGGTSEFNNGNRILMPSLGYSSVYLFIGLYVTKIT